MRDRYIDLIEQTYYFPQDGFEVVEGMLESVAYLLHFVDHGFPGFFAGRLHFVEFGDRHFGLLAQIVNLFLVFGACVVSVQRPHIAGSKPGGDDCVHDLFRWTHGHKRKRSSSSPPASAAYIGIQGKSNCRLPAARRFACLRSARERTERQFPAHVGQGVSQPTTGRFRAGDQQWS